jgi:hypothetical protein
MTFNIKKLAAATTAPIELITGDGSPLTDDKGNVLSITVHGPGSKVWQQADAENSRRRAVRVSKHRGRLAAGLDVTGEDEVDFLTAITISLNGWEYPHPEKDGKWPSPQDMFRALYADDELGFIRDHVSSEARDWGNFTKASLKS